MPLRTILAGLGLVVALGAASWTLAQTAPTISGALTQVRVDGTTAFADVVRTIVAARPGTPAERVDLEAERNRVYALGAFEEVSVSLEDRGAGPVLVVRVRENPRVAAVEFVGIELIDADAVRDTVIREHLLDAGRTLNAIRAEQAIDTVQEIYRSIGVPFDVPVLLEAIPDREAPTAEDGRAPVRLRYTVTETAPLTRVVFEDSSVLDAAELERRFSVVAGADTFGYTSYRAALDGIAARYGELGYRQSGVDEGRSELDGDGTLTIRFRELRIASFDTTALGIDASELSLAIGDLFNVDTLLEDVRRLAAGRTADVRVVPQVTATGAVRVAFAVGAPDTAGPVTSVVVEGNSAVSDDAILEQLTLREGDTFTSALAEEDFRRIRALYADRGVVIATQPAFSWRDDGTYVQRVQELRIAGYEVSYDGPPGRTETTVITRYLPRPGEVLDLRALDDGLRAVARLGAVTPVSRQLLPAEESDEVIVGVVVRAAQTGVFQPSAQYNTETGFSASLSFSESNLFGLAHSISAEVEGLTSDLGCSSGAASGTPSPGSTSTSSTCKRCRRRSACRCSRSSTSTSAWCATAASRRCTRARRDRRQPRARRRVHRALERRIARRRSARATEHHLDVGARVTYNQYVLEPAREPCEIEDGVVTNPDDCALPPEVAAEALPTVGPLRVRQQRPGVRRPRQRELPAQRHRRRSRGRLRLGQRHPGPGHGERRNYTYQQLEVGARTYLHPASLFPDAVSNPNHVFAVRLNAGHQFGGFYPDSRRFIVGRTLQDRTSIRGYAETDFDPSRTYATASLEYRYDFGSEHVRHGDRHRHRLRRRRLRLERARLRGVRDPIYAGLGVGVQVDLGFGGVALPPLRFDYGFSERNRGGVFAFRIGTVF
jgi:outer membrane protein insertion porin family